jgi:hypothetical protein
VKKSSGPVILSGAKDLSLFPSTKEQMLRYAQHDSFEFFHTFIVFPLCAVPAPEGAGGSKVLVNACGALPRAEVDRAFRRVRSRDSAARLKSRPDTKP